MLDDSGIWMDIPSGLHNWWERSTMLNGKNTLFLWPFSMAQMVNVPWIGEMIVIFQDLPTLVDHQWVRWWSIAMRWTYHNVRTWAWFGIHLIRLLEGYNLWVCEIDMMRSRWVWLPYDMVNMAWISYPNTLNFWP